MENYLSDDQRNFLIEEYTDSSLRIFKSLFYDNIDLDRDFLFQLAFHWSAEEIMDKEYYRYYVSRLLIKMDFSYLLRDIFYLGLECGFINSEK